jgi:hypothetical protein
MGQNKLLWTPLLYKLENMKNGEVLAAFNLKIPDRATKSFADNALWEKLCCSCDMLNVGAGNCLVSMALDVLPSFLPLGTSHLGPPDCRIYVDIPSVIHANTSYHICIY